MMRKPEECRTMDEIRVEIDRVDQGLVRLFSERASYIDQAARIKAAIRMPARIDERVEQVVGNVRCHAAEQGLPPDMIETLWRQLIDWSIAREESHLGQSDVLKGWKDDSNGD